MAIYQVPILNPVGIRRSWVVPSALAPAEFPAATSTSLISVWNGEVRGISLDGNI